MALAGAFFPESEFSREPFPAPGDLLAATSNFANVVCDPSTLWSNEDVQACCAGASLTAATDGAVTQKDEKKFPGREVGVGGAGYVIVDRGGSCVEEWAGPAGRKRTSYGAERVALTQASSRLTDLISLGPARGEDGVLPRVVILTDSMACLEKIRSANASGEGDLAMLRAVNALAEVATVLIRHVKAHHGIDLNEAADRLADIGQQMEFSNEAGAKTALAYDEVRTRVSIVLEQYRLDRMFDEQRFPEGSQVGKYRRFLNRYVQGKESGKNHPATRYLRGDVPRPLELIKSQLEIDLCARVYGPDVPFETIRLGGRCPRCAAVDCVSPNTAEHFFFECPPLQEAWWDWDQGEEELFLERGGGLVQLWEMGDAVYRYIARTLFEPRGEAEVLGAENALESDASPRTVRSWFPASDYGSDVNDEDYLLSHADVLPAPLARC